MYLDPDLPYLITVLWIGDVFSDASRAIFIH